MLVVAPLCVGLLGAVVERLVIRRLYGRMVDTMLATWGLSLVLIGAVTMIFGNTVSRLLRAARAACRSAPTAPRATGCS